MGEYKDKHNVSRVGNFLRGIKGVAPDILKLAGNVTGVDALKNLGEAIKGSDSISAEDKLKALDLLQLDIENTKDARDMQKVALQQEDLFSKRFVYYLAIFWSVIAATYLFLATFTTVVNPKMADTVLGFLLGTIIATVINFFFGSSSGSKSKTDKIIRELKN
jgi:hypothetical protein